MFNSNTNLNPKGEISNQMCIMSILSKMNKEMPMHAHATDDYGPQRFCTACGCRLEERIDKMSEIVFVHPDSDCEGITKVWPHLEYSPTKKTVVVVASGEDTTSNYMYHDNLEMDDLRNVYRKVLHTEWYKKNKEVIKKIYVDHADFAGVNPEIECCRFKEEVNDDEGNVVSKETECVDLDVGIADEEKTHMDKEHLKFWKSMVWMIGHCPDRAYDKAIEHLHSGFLDEDEVDWIATVTNGTRNNGKFREVQYKMMLARKCLKRNPLRWIPEPPKKVDNIKIRKEASYKYPGKNVHRITFDYYGDYATISKMDGCTSWLNPNGISTEDLNCVVNLARKAYVASKA